MTLTTTLREALAAGFTQLTAGQDAAEIVGYGVCSDSDASSLYLAAHTRSARDEQVAADPKYASSYVWNPDEWDLPDEDDAAHDLVPAANQALESLDDSDIAAHREAVWSAVVDAIAQLVDEGFFARSPEAIRVVLVMDGGEDRRPELAEYFGLEE
jgi:hypothetical protein